MRRQEDGYLYVSHICKVAHPREMGETPYSWVVHSHELYNLGHLYEGAIAYYRATGKDKWLKVAETSARHFNKVFFEGDSNYNDGRPVMQAPGHQELELALCKLYRVTGNRLYLDMAKRFLDIRGVTYRPDGEGTMSPSYSQQHKPVIEQTEAVGHAVRAGYLYAGMADVSALTGDLSYARAAEKIWHDIVDKKRGRATIERVWKPGDTVELNIPMPVRYSTTIDAVEANRNRIAITRGPLVYCAEQADNLASEKTGERGDIVQRFFVPQSADPSDIQPELIEDGLLKGVTRISVPAMEVIGDSVTASTVKLIPYYTWNNRGEESMIVWLPRNESLARKYMVSNQLTAADYGKVQATHAPEGATVAAVVDGRVPDTSADQGQPRWTSLPFKNRGQNIIFEFDKTRTVGSIAIYWYEERGGEGEKIRLPRDWWVDYRVSEGDWTRMKKYVTDDYGLERDKFNVVRPEAPLECDAISIRILPQVGSCMGVHEIRVEFDK